MSAGADASESVSGGVYWRSCVKGRGKKIVLPNTLMSLAVARRLPVQSLRKSGASRIAACAGASSARACANVRFFFSRLDARSSSTSRLRTAPKSSLSSASPALRRDGDSNALLGARGAGDVARLSLDDEVDPELDFPLVPTALVLEKPKCEEGHVQESEKSS
jgi:hypothetical protein